MSDTHGSGRAGGSANSAIRAATYSARVLSPRRESIARTRAGPTKIQNHNTRQSLAKRYTSRVFSCLVVASALVRAASRLVSTPGYTPRISLTADERRRDESRRGTHECGLYVALLI